VVFAVVSPLLLTASLRRCLIIIFVILVLVLQAASSRMQAGSIIDMHIMPHPTMP
jgi:hypothetical protein